MQTAEFIHDMDNLFYSLNGRTPKPEAGKNIQKMYITEFFIVRCGFHYCQKLKTGNFYQKMA